MSRLSAREKAVEAELVEVERRWRDERARLVAMQASYLQIMSSSDAQVKDLDRRIREGDEKWFQSRTSGKS